MNPKCPKCGGEGWLSQYETYCCIKCGHYFKVKVDPMSSPFEDNPFKSEAQRRYLWMHRPDIARRWTKKYGSRVQRNPQVSVGGRIGPRKPDDIREEQHFVIEQYEWATREDYPPIDAELEKLDEELKQSIEYWGPLDYKENPYNQPYRMGINRLRLRVIPPDFAKPIVSELADEYMMDAVVEDEDKGIISVPADEIENVQMKGSYGEYRIVRLYGRFDIIDYGRFDILDVEQNPGRDKYRIENINQKITTLTYNKYLERVPLVDIFHIIHDEGYVPLQEDDTEWSGFLVGPEGRAHIILGDSESFVMGDYGEPIYVPLNLSLNITWYRMESGRYEVVAYVS